MGRDMNWVKSLLLAGGASLALTAGASAADLPTKKDQPPPEKPNCFATFWTWLDSTPKDCPLSAYGVTVYGTISAGGGWAAHTAPINGYSTQGVPYLIQKFSRGPAWQEAPMALGGDGVGIKIKEALPFATGWSIIGDLNYQFDTMTFTGINGPESLIQNNGRYLIYQTNNGSSAVNGQFDNGRGYFGLDNKTYGTLTAGRQTTFAGDAVGNYDPTGGSNAFSPIGYSSTYLKGFGITETSRYNTSIKYVLNYPVAANANFRVGAMGQVGGYAQWNASTGAFQVDVGGDYYGFSGDVIYAWAQNTFTLATYGSSLPAGVDPNTYLTATLANVQGVLAVGKYNWNQWTVYGGYSYYVYSNPSNNYPGGLSDVVSTGYDVLPSGIKTPEQYYNNRVVQIGWGGLKYSVFNNLDLIGAGYVINQNNYYSYESAGGKAENCGPNTSYGGPKTTEFPKGTYPLKGPANGYCAGNIYAGSGLIDWRPWKRVDVFAGLMYSTWNGGFSSGALNTWNIDPTAGIRISF